MKNKKITTIIALLLGLFFSSAVNAKELCDCFGSCITLYERNLTQTTKNYIKKRDGYSGQSVEIDHKIPLCLGGSNSKGNLRALTRSAHRKKTKTDMLLLESVKNCNISVLEAYRKANKKP